MKDSVVVFRMDVFMLDTLTNIEASVAGSSVTFSSNIFTFTVLLILVLFSGCLYVQ